MSKTLRLSNSDDEKLIELVWERPFLWHMADKSYKEQVLKNTRWKEIGAKIDKTTDQCRMRWRSIRDNFRKYKRQERGTTGSAAKKRDPYWDRLRFLDAVEDEREAVSNEMEANSPDFATPQLTGSSSSSGMEEEAPTSGKRKLTIDKTMENLINARREDRQELFAYLEKLAEPEDDIDLFLRQW